MSISSLENCYLGETVFVVGAGKSVDYYSDEFWQDKTIIGINQVGKKLPVDYTVRKEGAEGYGGTLVRSQYKYGARDELNHGGYLFSHHNNSLTRIKADNLHPYGESLVVSYSTITSAIHLAAYMGAQTIYVAGHDCKPINGELTFEGYYEGERYWGNDDDYEKWLGVIAPQTEWITDYVEANYGCDVIFLQPKVTYAE